MLRGNLVRLRASDPQDAEFLHELWDNVDTHLVADDGPYVPRSVAAQRAELEKNLQPQDGPPPRDIFMVAESQTDGALIGTGGLWGIDRFNRVAHLGIVLLPAQRGKGYGAAIIELLCEFGFRLHNLRRLELETLGSNLAMRRTAEKVGFSLEGVQRERDFTGDGYSDIAIYGLLRTEWPGLTR
jgi:RimJ/RimL family protein N-acetyltransferase